MCVRSTRGKTIQTRADYGDPDSTGRIKETLATPSQDFAFKVTGFMVLHPLNL